ncbi:MAG: MoaD family protein [Pirellulales bacterium]|nr:MoaD family protein [Pirellulales bacterium]
MLIAVQIPTALRAEIGGTKQVSVEASTVRDALEQLELLHPKLYRSVCEETGAVRRHINLFVNLKLVRRGTGLNTALHPGDTLTIMPAVSGG